MAMLKTVLLIAILLLPSSVFGFAAPAPKALASPEKASARLDTIPAPLENSNASYQVKNAMISLVPATMVLTTAFPAEAAAGIVPSALWAYAHYLSIIVITGLLTAEKCIVKADMGEQEEGTIVKLDLVYGLMAVLLIASGFARATEFGKGSDFYLHEPLFWVKMTFSGIWGGLSLFPSLTFYKRNFRRKNNETVPPLSDKLAGRLQQVINAELSAMLSIPLLATTMSRGVWYWQDFPWPIGAVISVLATGGSFFFYGRQALTWTEEENDGGETTEPVKED